MNRLKMILIKLKYTYMLKSLKNKLIPMFKKPKNSLINNLILTNHLFNMLIIS